MTIANKNQGWTDMITGKGRYLIRSTAMNMCWLNRSEVQVGQIRSDGYYNVECLQLYKRKY